ncbi:MAG: hypothetical protein P8Y73_11785, partial [Desulfuromonadales bacterium]
PVSGRPPLASRAFDLLDAQGLLAGAHGAQLDADGGSSLVKGREMTERILERSPEIDFLYYSNDMIGAGGMLYLLDHLQKKGPVLSRPLSRLSS